MRIKTTKKYPEVYTDDSIKLLKSRFLKTDEEGNPIETIEEMFKRVAEFIASADSNYYKRSDKKKKEVKKTSKEFYSALYELRLVPNSPTLINAGRFDRLYSACFVLPIKDDLKQIMSSLADATKVQQYGGGTGWNFSAIREKGAMVNGIDGVAAGPIHFIKAFSEALVGIRQIGKRGGGNMAILNIDHPDIEEFISLKADNKSIANFNISVGITNKFMDALRNDDEFELISRYDGHVVKRVKAWDLFEKLAQMAWATGDPGIAFVDKINEDSPTPNLGIMNATNPCGEQPLLPYESCNLAAVNLRVHFDPDRNELDWKKMKKTINTGVHFLDNIIDVNNYPVDKIEEISRFKNRKIGLGLMGFADVLYMKGIKYDSKEAIEYAEKVMKFINEEGHKASIKLAKIRGTFPNYKGSKWEKLNKPMRNATVTTIAPNGNTSIIGGSAGGIEPVFSIAYKVAGVEDANYKATTILYRINQGFEQVAKREGFYSKDLVEKLAKGKHIKDIDEIPERWKKIFVTAMDISPLWHIKMQNAFQKYTDNAISKTINMPNQATVEDVKKVYLFAYDTTCKGVTIYRDGSKFTQTYVAEGNAGNLNVKGEEKTTELKWNEEKGVTKNGLQVLEKRALKKDANGEIIESPRDLWRRIARKVASAEKLYNKSDREVKEIEDQFFEVMNNLEFLSGGTLIWAGMDSLGMEALMSKCFVLPINDSVESIFGTLKRNIEILKRGGGTGFNFSKIRSVYSTVSTTGEKAAGPIEYLMTYNRAQDTLRGRGGRQMGSMAILNVDHPNIIDFIKSKDNNNNLSHYNISVGITDKFMEAVRSDDEWSLIDPADKEVKKKIRAQELWAMICKHAWETGDPGLFFLDEAERHNTTPDLGRIEATNPCGEQPLLPYESCNLGNINLSRFVDGFPFIETKEILGLDEAKKYIKWDRLEEVARIGVRFLDNIIDINNYPVKEIEEMTKYTRNIGLGVMGVADMFIKLGIPYSSSDAVELVEEVMGFIQEISHDESNKIGKEKGSFPAFEDSVWKKDRGYEHMRNTRTTTIAPTGSISIIAGCNPGIEPIFALSYTRINSMGGLNQKVLDPLFEAVAKKFGFYSEDLITYISEGGKLEDLDIAEPVKQIFRTSHEIRPEQHVKIQSAFQRNVDSGVSKTINMSNSATIEDVDKVYKLAYELKCKGITVFRDGSKEGAQVVKSSSDSSAVSKTVNSNITTEKMSGEKIRKKRGRPQTTFGTTTEIQTDQGQLYITVNEDEIGISEVFLNIGRSGGHNAAYTEALGRMISLALRSNISPKEIVKQLKGIRTSNATFNKGFVVYSVPDAVAKVLEQRINEREEKINMLDDITKPEASSEDEVITEKQNLPYGSIERRQEVEEVVYEKSVQTEITAGVFEAKNDGKKDEYSTENIYDSMLECPDCGGSLEYAEGCVLCRSCGFSKCG